MQSSIPHLEPLTRFRHRITELNRLYNHDDPVHPLMEMDGETWHRTLESRDAERLPVTEALSARKSLAAIHQTFPAEAPVPEQAAYLIRAFNGMRPFQAANHRTGWDYAAEVLHHAGHDVVATEPEVHELGNELWSIMDGAYPDGFHASKLLDQDEVWDYLTGYMHRRVA